MSTSFELRRKPGMMYGPIELLEEVGNNGKHKIWRCKCHACGRVYDKVVANIHKNIKSCGCLYIRQNHNSPNWRGVGEISSVLITHYKVNAKRRNIDFNITGEYMWELFIKQERKCALSGVEIKFGRMGRDECTASLDRIKSKLPYQEGNVQWVHKHINMMKLDHDQEYFIKLCSLITFKKSMDEKSMDRRN